MRKLRRKRVAVASMAVALAAAGSAAAFQQLPANDQVNNDPANHIDPAQGVNGEDPTNADVVGGALVAGKPAVPWAIFRQKEASGAKDQIFSRSFAAGAWLTRGIGTVGGRSSASPTFSASLNFDQGQDGEAPSIDFAGAGRTVPWATWYENTTGTGFGANNIFASRFDATAGDPNVNKWLFEGQGRGTGGSGPQVPSLNIHTNRSAENPVVAGGATNSANAPVPWVTWQEVDGSSTGPQQIFTSKAVKPTAAPTCPADGVNPSKPASATGAIATFCWQQVGVERFTSGATTVPPSTTDPSMNIDRTRDGIEPDMAFTGTGDTVPWVVWYEKGTSGDSLNNNEMVFAAKAVAPSTAPPPTGTVDGGFNWVAVGGTGSGVLDFSAHGGSCGTSVANEEACSLNKVGTADAEDPRVASGTMTAGGTTVPWVAWDESVGLVHKIFVSRLVTTAGPAHFELANNGAPISIDANDATRPDITFDGNTPYVTWREDIGGGVTKGFSGHFTTPQNFVIDATDVPLSPTGTGPGQADVREPISSGCTANPFNADGSTCQGSAIGTPFFLFTTGTGPLNLLADAYQPSATTGGASNVTTSSATINGNVATHGAAVNVSFQFGTTTAYGGTTPTQKTGPDSPSAFSAALTGLPANTTIHYRIVATSDFAPPTVGQDQTLKTNAIPPTPKPGHASFGHVSVSGTTASVRTLCSGNSVDSCRLSYRLTVTETRLGKRIVAVGARAKRLKRHKVTVTVGTASTFLRAGQSRVVKISLNGTGKSLLSKYRTLHTTLRVTQSGKKGSVLSTRVTFKAPPKKKHHH